mgnify:CR=1 FL=1
MVEPFSIRPWLAQIGQDRGGFYSYDELENLVGCEMPTADERLPGKQAWSVGDKLWMYPPSKAGGLGYATLRTLDAGHALGFSTRAAGTPLTMPEDGSWSFVLESVDADTTRLIVRGRGAGGRPPLGVAFDRAIFEPAHFVMERRMMVGIKQLSEGGSRHRWSNHVQVVLWTLTFVMFLTAPSLVLHRAAWGRALAGFALAGVVFQVLTLVQPPVLVGVVLTAAVAACLWPTRSRSRIRRPAVTPGFESSDRPTPVRP